jgi:TIR domain
MPKIFISYKREELDYALAVKRWLTDKLNAEIFVDVEGVEAGEAWQEALRCALRKVRVVLFLASERSINSPHCREELDWAGRFSTRVIPLLLDLRSGGLRGITALDVELSGLQALELRRGQMQTIAFKHEGRPVSVQLSAEALDRLVQDLREIDVQATDLPWPARERWEVRKKPSDAPYPSLEAFGVDDGGIFFGRTADAIAVLNDLDRIHQDRTPPLFIIEAASGAGKSSFLQAGLWARLLRRHRARLGYEEPNGAASFAISCRLGDQRHL